MTKVVSPEEFVQAFDAVVSGMEKQLLREWLDQTKYTATFFTPQVGVLPQVASQLGFEYHREVGRVDAIFYQPLNGVKRVSVAIEHEHWAEGTRREAWTLSMWNVPLKVLITYPEPGEEQLLLDSYVPVFEATDLFQDFHNVKRQLMIFGFADESVDWRYYVYSKTGFVRLGVTT
jgi:hypothetical protein